jgi:hypothetical protein
VDSNLNGGFGVGIMTQGGTITLTAVEECRRLTLGEVKYLGAAELATPR